MVLLLLKRDRAVDRGGGRDIEHVTHFNRSIDKFEVIETATQTNCVKHTQCMKLQMIS